MRRGLVAVAVVSWAAVSQAGIVNDFGDIRFWAGSGTNQAAFVLDFGTAAPQAAPAAVAWGYRWNGSANLADMIFALAGTITGSGAPLPVAGSDPRLGVDASYYSSFNSYFINTISYDQVGLPVGWSQQTRILLGDDPDNDMGTAQYGAAAAGGLWPAGGTFAVSSLGPSGTGLETGGWYGYVFTTYTYVYDPVYDDFFPEYPATYAFSQPTAAVPEPAAIMLAAGGLGAVALGWRRRGRCGDTLGGSPALLSGVPTNS